MLLIAVGYFSALQSWNNPCNMRVKVNKYQNQLINHGRALLLHALSSALPLPPPHHASKTVSLANIDRWGGGEEGRGRGDVIGENFHFTSIHFYHIKQAFSSFSQTNYSMIVDEECARRLIQVRLPEGWKQRCTREKRYENTTEK